MNPNPDSNQGRLIGRERQARDLEARGSSPGSNSNVSKQEACLRVDGQLIKGSSIGRDLEVRG